MTEYMAKNGKPGRAEDVDKTPLEDVSKDTVNSYSILLCTLLWQNKYYHLLDFSQIFLTFADDPEVLKDVPEDHCRLPLHCLLHLHMIVDCGLPFSSFFTPKRTITQPLVRFLKANDLGVFLAGSYQIAHIEYGITKHVFVLISSQV